MPMKSLIVYLVFIFCFPFLVLQAQWIQTDGPYGKMEIGHLFSSDSIIISGARAGIFSRSENQARWSFHHAMPIHCYTMDGDDLYIGTMYDGIYKMDLDNLDDPPAAVSTLYADALTHSDELLIAGHNESGIYTSMNGGADWIPADEGLPVDSVWDPWAGMWYTLNRVYCLATSGDHVFCGTNEGVFRTSLDVQTWEDVSNGIPAEEIDALYATGESLYATIGNILYKSTDAGEQWTQIHTASSEISSLVSRNDTTFISMLGNGVAYSTDETTWNTVNNGLPTLKVNQLDVFSGQLVCGTEGEGVFIYDDGQWTAKNSGLIISDSWSLTVCNDQVFCNDPDKVYRLDQEGTWTDITPAVDYELFRMVVSMDDRVFLSVEHNQSTWPYDVPFILYTADAGQTWQELFNQPPFAGDDPYSIYTDNGRLYARENEIMHYTDDLGETWHDMSLPAQFCNYFYNFLVFNGTPFAGACGYNELVKYNSGSGWMLSNNGLPAYNEIESLAYNENVLFTYLSYDGMYASHNNGESWEPAGSGLDIADWGIMDFASFQSHLFVSSFDGVFFTSNNGQYWAPFNEGLKNLRTTGLAIHNDTLYAGTFSNGVWKVAIEDVPLSLSLGFRDPGGLKIIPNPAMENVQIAAAGIQQGRAMICTLNGTVLLEFDFHPGRVLNVSSLANGMYFVILQSRNDRRVSRLVICR